MKGQQCGWALNSAQDNTVNQNIYSDIYMLYVYVYIYLNPKPDTYTAYIMNINARSMGYLGLVRDQDASRLQQQAADAGVEQVAAHVRIHSRQGVVQQVHISACRVSAWSAGASGGIRDRFLRVVV